VWDNNIGPIVFLNIKNHKLGFCFCHKIKNRSIWFFGLEKILCSRCLGILLGGATGLILVASHYRMDLMWSVVLLIPLLLDGSSQALQYRESNNETRLITGFLFGVGLQFFLSVVFLFIKNGFFSSVKNIF
jgi:uncharacterized membrane protein